MDGQMFLLGQRQRQRVRSIHPSMHSSALVCIQGTMIGWKEFFFAEELGTLTANITTHPTQRRNYNMVPGTSKSRESRRETRTRLAAAAAPPGPAKPFFRGRNRRREVVVFGLSVPARLQPCKSRERRNPAVVSPTDVGGGGRTQPCQPPRSSQQEAPVEAPWSRDDAGACVTATAGPGQKVHIKAATAATATLTGRAATRSTTGRHPRCQQE